MDDAALVALLCQGDQAGMEELHRRYGGMIHYIVRGILSDPRDVEECISDISMGVWQGAKGFDPARGSLSTWLTAVARNTAVSHLRASRRHTDRQTPLEENQPGGESPEEKAIRTEQVEQLQAALAGLSSRERTLFYRKYYYLQSTERIARELGMTQRAVEGRLYRLRQKLRQRLGGEWE